MSFRKKIYLSINCWGRTIKKRCAGDGLLTFTRYVTFQFVKISVSFGSKISLLRQCVVHPKSWDRARTVIIQIHDNNMTLYSDLVY